MNGRYVGALIKTWIIAVIAFAICHLIFYAVNNGDAGIEVFVFACTPFGWTLVNKIIPFNLVGTSWRVVPFWLLKIALSAAIGVIAFPIINIYYIAGILFSAVKSKREMRNKELDTNS